MMTEKNMFIWEKAKLVPATAIKPIIGGRLKGMSDINPVWRMKKLTELFGPCGFGWKYEITNKWLEKGAKDEVSAFVDINLYVSGDGVWSEAIPGTGGSSYIANEKNGLYTSDECFKMALTDAISVACKSLGIGADVYWDKDKTKYSQSSNNNGQLKEETQTNKVLPSKEKKSEITQDQVTRLYAIAGENNISNADVKEYILKKYKKVSTLDLTKKEYEEVCAAMQKKK